MCKHNWEHACKTITASKRVYFQDLCHLQVIYQIQITVFSGRDLPLPLLEAIEHTQVLLI